MPRQKHFGENYRDDESDAFRHCLWSALIVMRIGIDRSKNTLDLPMAKKWLNAHESCSFDEKGSMMDHKNNQIGIDLASELHRKGGILYPEIVDGCFDALKSNKLTVLKPRGVPNELKTDY